NGEFGSDDVVDVLVCGGHVSHPVFGVDSLAVRGHGLEAGNRDRFRPSGRAYAVPLPHCTHLISGDLFERQVTELNAGSQAGVHRTVVVPLIRAQERADHFAIRHPRPPLPQFEVTIRGRSFHTAARNPWAAVLTTRNVKASAS